MRIIVKPRKFLVTNFTMFCYFITHEKISNFSFDFTFEIETFVGFVRNNMMAQNFCVSLSLLILNMIS